MNFKKWFYSEGGLSGPGGGTSQDRDPDQGELLKNIVAHGAGAVSAYNQGENPPLTKNQKVLRVTFNMKKNMKQK